MARKISRDTSYEFSNFVEYCIEKRPEGAYKRNRILFRLGMLVLALSIFVISGTSIGKMLLPLVPVWFILVGFAFWYLNRFFNIEYEYRILQGEFQMDTVYGQKKKAELITVRVRDMEIIHPYDDEEAKADVAKCDKVVDCSISKVKPTPDVYYFTYTEDGKRTAVIFEATKKTLDVMKFHNAKVLTYKEGLRH